ncbi:MAG: GIY-YIG nuclease family protein [archaeon]|nr:GIY-YIG nuclease family protein [archaeon]
MEKKYYFYTLQSSDAPNEIRYVGVTTQSLKQRFSEHKYKANSQKYRSQPVHKWMFSKFQSKLNIIIKYLDECLESEWKDREKYWIKFYKDSGAKLLNL